MKMLKGPHRNKVEYSDQQVVCSKAESDLPFHYPHWEQLDEEKDQND